MEHAKIHRQLVARYGRPVAIDTAGTLRAMGLRGKLHPKDAVACRYASLAAATAFAEADREHYGHEVIGPVETEIGPIAVVDLRSVILRLDGEPTDPGVPDETGKGAGNLP